MPRVKDFMAAGPLTIDPDDTVREALALMTRHGLDDLPVVDYTHRLLGVVTKTDVADLIWDTRLSDNQVARYMRRDMPQVREEDDLSQVQDLLKGPSMRQIPVVRDQRLVGVVRGDILRAEQAESQVARPHQPAVKPAESRTAAAPAAHRA